MSSTPVDVYPLSTAAGVAIPLDVGKPVGAVKITTNVSSPVAISLPGELNLCNVCFNTDTFLTIGSYFGSLGNTYQAGAMYLVAGVVYDLLLPATTNLLALTKAGTGYINVMQSWAQLQNQNYGVS